jgi:hypothetical protein
MLQEAAAADLHDYFEFLVGEAREELDGAPEGGSRYPAEGEVLEPLDVGKGGTGWTLAASRRRPFR